MADEKSKQMSSVGSAGKLDEVPRIWEGQGTLYSLHRNTPNTPSVVLESQTKHPG